jgi:hypothetical protein
MMFGLWRIYLKTITPWKKSKIYVFWNLVTLSSKLSNLLALPDPEDGGTIIFSNISNHSPNNMAPSTQ